MKKDQRSSFGSEKESVKAREGERRANAKGRGRRKRKVASTKYSVTARGWSRYYYLRLGSPAVQQKNTSTIWPSNSLPFLSPPPQGHKQLPWPIQSPINHHHHFLRTSYG